ncbi:MAG: UDP-N-acetylglucosamine 2-epimerase [Peptostreptococcaceae bacterium]|nr:UDP-N-acetylglucosamine 2-epimerase [Peptostreptococcaceae bacterium]
MKGKKVCVVTGTRAEYGLLRPLMERLRQDPALHLQVAATGMHLSPEFGCTYREIEKDGFVIDEKVETLLSSDTKTAVAKSMGLGMIGFADAFSRLSPDVIVLLGDRYEIFAAAAAAMILNLPLAHIHGGESTFGLVDEAIRHGITKMSYLHFASAEGYRQRIIQLGESPERVFCVGALGIENIRSLSLLSKGELEREVGFRISEKTAVVTFHPLTLGSDSSERQFAGLLEALDSFEDMNFIFTKANADAEGRVIHSMIDDFVRKNPERSVAFTSMGQKRYLSALRYAGMVIGNSSSGIIEAPSFSLPTVNIGDRQSGRIRAKTVIDCGIGVQEIRGAIKKAKGKEFRKMLSEAVNPYEKEGTSLQIFEKIKEFLLSDTMDLRKRFYDIALEKQS